MIEVQPVLVLSSNGVIHVGLVLEDGLYTLESCNLDQTVKAQMGLHDLDLSVVGIEGGTTKYCERERVALERILGQR